MSTRTDVHRPASPQFDPELYALYGVFDTHPEWGSGASRQQAVRRLVDRGFRFGAGSSNQCGHCGARIRYAALMVRENVKEFIFVGETCLDNRFELSKAEFDRLREEGRLNRERATRAERTEALVAENPDLAWASYAYNIQTVANTDWEKSTLADIFGKADRYGDITARQAEFVSRLVTRITEADIRVAAREAERAALADAGVAVPDTTKRITVEGTVLSTKTVDSQFGTQYKMLVKHDTGWKVWGTIPIDIAEVERGDRVRFVARVERSGDDPLFGFYSRPTKAEVVAGAAATAA